MTQSKLNPEAMLCFDIYALQQAFSRVYRPLLSPLGLTYPQYLVLVVLWENAPLSVGQIGGRLGLESSTLTPLIKRLQQSGLATRVRDSGDERRVMVNLTAEGKALEARARDVPACVEAATGLDSDGIAWLRGELATLREAIGRETVGRAVIGREG